MTGAFTILAFLAGVGYCLWLTVPVTEYDTNGERYAERTDGEGYHHGTDPAPVPRLRGIIPSRN